MMLNSLAIRFSSNRKYDKIEQIFAFEYARYTWLKSFLPCTRKTKKLDEMMNKGLINM